MQLRFPDYIVEAVDAVTRRKPAESNGAARWKYIERCKANPIARVVKIADLEHNSDLSRIKNPTEKMKRRNNGKRNHKSVVGVSERSGENDYL